MKVAQSKKVPLVVSDELLEAAHDLRIKDSRVLAVESARKSLKEIMNEILEDREKAIVRHHYGLTMPEKVPGQRKAKSLSQIGKL